jgi:hypothetical protein
MGLSIGLVLINALVLSDLANILGCRATGSSKMIGEISPFRSLADLRLKIASFPAEDFFQQGRGLGGRVLADLFFLFSQHMEQAV